MPCRAARARMLLRSGKAAVFRRYPFTIILKSRVGGNTQPVSLNVDPGSKVTGIALVASFQRGATAIAALHIEHRGQQIKEALDRRRAARRSRRQRKTRYRKARFLNRTRPQGWLPPSLLSRVHHVETWAKRLTRWVPITDANVETVRFDMQLMENATIAGIEYQQGTLFGYELREYLLQRHRHTCAYCDGLSKDVVLNIEHVMPRRLGGTDRVANLVIACRTCNEHKGVLHPQAWADDCASHKSLLDRRRASNMLKIVAGYRPSLRDAAAVNATRYAVGRAIRTLIPNSRFWSGGRTKRNRVTQSYTKDHWIDAACIGALGEQVALEPTTVITAKAQGHGTRQMCRMNRFGFPRTGPKGPSVIHGFKTGDRVRAVVPSGKHQGKHIGRVAVRSSGSFNITHLTTLQGISHRFCEKLHADDGYHYQLQRIAPNLRGGCERLAA